jgi:hypothetical protein
MRLQALYTVGELAEMAGVNEKRMRRFLVRKGLIEEGNGKRGAEAEVELDALVERAPGFWKSISRRLSTVENVQPRSQA